MNQKNLEESEEDSEDEDYLLEEETEESSENKDETLERKKNLKIFILVFSFSFF